MVVDLCLDSADQRAARRAVPRTASAAGQEQRDLGDMTGPSACSAAECANSVKRRLQTELPAAQHAQHQAARRQRAAIDLLDKARTKQPTQPVADKGRPARSLADDLWIVEPAVQPSGAQHQGAARLAVPKRQRCALAAENAAAMQSVHGNRSQHSRKQHTEEDNSAGTVECEKCQKQLSLAELADAQCGTGAHFWCNACLQQARQARRQVALAALPGNARAQSSQAASASAHPVPRAPQPDMTAAAVAAAAWPEDPGAVCIPVVLPCCDEPGLLLLPLSAVALHQIAPRCISLRAAALVCPMCRCLPCRPCRRPFTIVRQNIPAKKRAYNASCTWPCSIGPCFRRTERSIHHAVPPVLGSALPGLCQHQLGLAAEQRGAAVRPVLPAQRSTHVSGGALTFCCCCYRMDARRYARMV